jgi:hypothetical protein
MRLADHAALIVRDLRHRSPPMKLPAYAILFVGLALKRSVTNPKPSGRRPVVGHPPLLATGGWRRSRGRLQRAKALRARRYPANPSPAKPNSIITQVEGSGAWLTPNENPIGSTSRAAKGKIAWSGES